MRRPSDMCCHGSCCSLATSTSGTTPNIAASAPHPHGASPRLASSPYATRAPLTLGREALLVVGAANAHDVALELLAQAGNVDVLAHALVDEAARLVLVVDLKRLLRARRGVAGVRGEGMSI
jgi:hypothetical protein